MLGHDVVREPFAIRRRLNMASGNASFVWSLRPAEVLSFYGRLYGLLGRRAARAASRSSSSGASSGRTGKTEYNELSTGLKQRLAMAKALLNEPEVLFLDEPTLGLDPDVSIRIRAQIAELRRERGTTIILTTHYMREAEELCDAIAFIKAGRILAEGTRRRAQAPDPHRRRDRAAPRPRRARADRRAARHPPAPRARGAHRVHGGRRRTSGCPRSCAGSYEQGVLVRDCQVQRARARGGLR